MSEMGENRAVDYDQVSQVYDTSRMAIPDTYDKLIQLLQISEGSLVLDMGCGTGNYTGTIKLVTERVIGIDKSPGMLKQARGKHAELSLLCGDVTNLPFKSGTFDAAFSTYVIHHIKNKEAFLNEAYRIVRNGARFAIDSCSHQQMGTFWFYYYFPKGLELDLARIPDSLEIIWLLEQAGFCDINIEISYTDIVREHEKPERYLDENYRGGSSTFNLLSEGDIDLGCRKLREDIASGAIEGIIRLFEAKETKVGGSCMIYGTKRE